MADVALFHSLLGPRPGIHEAAERIRGWGHTVIAVDQYGGRVFDDYDEAEAFTESLGGYPKLMADALAAVGHLDDGFLCVGFSNGGGMSEYIATQRRVAGVVMCSGALPLEMLGVDSWPEGVPAQIHYMVDDPFRHEGWAESVAESVVAAGAEVESFDYAGAGHLFADASRPDDYDAEAAELLWSRVEDFCRRHG